MPRFWASLAIMFSTPLIYSASAYADSVAGQADEVIQWNKTLLTIVRTPGAQPATVHPTRSFAIMHAAIYDAVNAIDATHKPYSCASNMYRRAPRKKRRWTPQLTRHSSRCIPRFKPRLISNMTDRCYKFRTVRTR